MNLGVSGVNDGVAFDNGRCNRFLPAGLHLKTSLVVPVSRCGHFAVTTSTGGCLMPAIPTRGRKRSGSRCRSHIRHRCGSVSNVDNVFGDFDSTPNKFGRRLRRVGCNMNTRCMCGSGFTLHTNCRRRDRDGNGHGCFAIKTNFGVGIFSLSTSCIMTATGDGPLSRALHFALTFSVSKLGSLFGQ